MQQWGNTLKSWDKTQKLIVCFAHYWLTFPQDLSLSHKHIRAPSTRWCDPTQSCIYHLSDTWTTLVPKATFRLGEIGTKKGKILACGPALYSYGTRELSPKHRKPCICSTAGNTPELVLANRAAKPTLAHTDLTTCASASKTGSLYLHSWSKHNIWHVKSKELSCEFCLIYRPKRGTLLRCMAHSAVLPSG